MLSCRFWRNAIWTCGHPGEAAPPARWIGIGLAVWLGVGAGLGSPAAAQEKEKPPAPMAEKPAPMADKPAPMADKPAAPKPEKPEKPAKPNPVQNILRGIFGGPNVPPPAAKPPAKRGGTIPDEAPASGSRDRLDARAASDVELSRRVGQLQTLIRGERWDDAIDVVEFLLEVDEDRLYRTPQGQWVSLLGEVERITLALPEEGLRNYRNRFDGPARTARGKAQESGSFDELVRVASRYFATPGGMTAAEDIAAILEDQGDYAASAHWTRRLIAAKAPGTETPEWKVRAARRLAMGGDRLAAEALLKGIPDLRPFLQVAAPAAATPAVAGAEPLTPQAWLDGMTPGGARGATVVRDTRMPYGEAAHGAVFAADAPLLFSRWRQSLVRRYAVEEQVQTLVWDLIESKKATLPALFPVAAAGKVAVRTLFGVAVFDAETGAPSWRLESDVAPERLLAGEPLRRTQGRTMIQGFISPAYDGANPEQHPLTSVLYRDGVHGSLSSDGRRLFVLEDIALMPQNVYGYWQQEDVVDPLGRDWKSNSLAAYDLQTGRRMWRIGGRKIEDVFAPPLAGTYFFGAPVVDGDELFVIGEANDAVSLHCLRASTGEPLWSQQISGVGQTISRDMVRRGWPCWPAVGEGIIVCPTTSGWLVALDRVQHRFLWTHRYSAPVNTPNTRNGYFINQPLDLHARWYPGAPILMDGTVLFGPSELPDETGSQQPVLVALDARTGKPKWPPRPKGNSLVLAGAADGRAYVTDVLSLKAINVASGATVWETPWPELGDVPSGRGLLTETAFLQPMRSGALHEFDRQTGKIRRTQKLRAGDDAPGNLFALGGRVFSVTAQELVAWEPDQPLETFEKEAKTSPLAALRLAELYLRLQRPEDAVDAARKVETQEPELVRKRRDILWEGLWTLASGDLTAHEEAARELEQFASTATDRDALVRLHADRASAQGKFVGAWEAYRKLVATAGTEMIVDGNQTTRQDVWLADRLAQVYEKLDGEPRKEADVRRQLEGAADVPALRRVVRLFGFHPDADAAHLRLAGLLEQANDSTGAGIHLRQLQRSERPEVAALATWQLASLYERLGWTADARLLLEELRVRFPEAALPDGAAGDLAAKALERIPVASSVAMPVWTGDYEVVRVFREHQQQSRALPPFGERPAFLEDKLLQVSLQNQRIALLTTDNRTLWSAPLRSSPLEMYSQESPIVLRGPMTYVVHNGVIHAFSLLEKKPLWTHIPDLRGSARTFYRQPQFVQTYSMQKIAAFAQPRMLSRMSVATGMLGAVSDQAAVVYDRRSIQALDPESGAMLWERRGTRQDSMVYLDGDRLYLFSSSDRPVLLDVRSGRVLKKFDSGSPLDKARQVVEGGLIHCEITGKSDSRKFRIAKTTHVDLATGKVDEVWKQEFSDDSWAVPVSEREFFVVEPDGRTAVLNLQTGRVMELASVKEVLATLDPIRRRTGQLQCLMDRERIYLFVDQKMMLTNTYLPGPNIRCSGACVALDRREPKIAWQQDVSGFNLPIDRTGDLPVLPFVAVQNVNRDDLHFQDIKLRVLDKSTGKALVDWQGKSYSSHIQGIVADFPGRAIEFRSYNETFLVRPAVAGAAPVIPAAGDAPGVAPGPPVEKGGDKGAEKGAADPAPAPAPTPAPRTRPADSILPAPKDREKAPAREI
ncbi:PQQ-binding-like beta-propeller repeat protein [Planctomyces sp. SH-PL14]|uniref:outer membrane protein assembly factor BamB family protein n=1 Tax=Planctomyces sp. SH-PL14 TaxID=1632864 RepID=UPI00078E30AA|nr:PQQ-binding-like beta-propeller repeat protein [Planctomyces sp. SH-PL14]AMV20329.1 outer membrane biogenesis protein BamB [Planctomyces sp. SH-PL14]